LLKVVTDSKTWGSHSCVAQDSSLLGCHAMSNWHFKDKVLTTHMIWMIIMHILILWEGRCACTHACAGACTYTHTHTHTHTHNNHTWYI